MNGHMEHAAEGSQSLSRAEEAEHILDSIKHLILNFIQSADNDVSSRTQSKGTISPDQTKSTHSLLQVHPPKELERLLNFRLPDQPQGLSGISILTQSIQSYSVNTWSQGFLDKLYHSPSPIGIAADLLLSSLNTNVHIYDVAPALTIIEKHTTRAVASAFGLHGRWAGGISQPGGSAANSSSIVIARNTLFPETKTEGLGGKKFVLFTSAHGHYSVEKAAQICGFGSNAVRTVPVDASGRMDPQALDSTIETAKRNGETPFYVNATAGTTVRGSFDPFDSIAEICQKHRLWFHVDASWGGGIVFSDAQRWKLRGVDRADSIAFCPHKMLGVPLTCSLLLGKDLRQFQRAMTLPAGYLFHHDNVNSEEEGEGTNGTTDAHDNGYGDDFWDLADLTPQCGRRGDVLKLALSWVYYGTEGYAAYIDHAFEIAGHLVKLVSKNSKFTMVSEIPPPCLQVCFYYDKQTGPGASAKNSAITVKAKSALLAKGFMVDYAPGEEGKFFRIVVNGQTRMETVERLVEAIEGGSDFVALH